MNLFTDCGAYLYTASREWRNRFRSTAFHNVVQVDDQELNRFISPENLWQFHDDARPRDVVWKSGGGVDYFRGSHTGYLRLTPPVTVTREIALVKDGPDVIVRDTIGGEGTRDLVWRFHLDPSVVAEIVVGGVRLSSQGREAWFQLVAGPHDMTMTLENGWSSASYGVRDEIRVVVMRVRAAIPQVSTFRLGLLRLPIDRLHEVAAGTAVAVVRRDRWNLNDASTPDEHGRRGRGAHAAAVRPAGYGAHPRYGTR